LIAAMFLATVITASRRPSWSRQQAQLPASKNHDQAREYVSPSAAAWVQQYTFRFLCGAPTPGLLADSAETEVRISHRIPRTIDFLSLAAMSDGFFGRIFLVLGQIVPFGTVFDDDLFPR